MKLLVSVLNSREGIQEDINYLKYQLEGRQGGEYDNDNLPKLRISKSDIKFTEPLTVMLECEDCDIYEYLGGIKDIRYIILS